MNLERRHAASYPQYAQYTTLAKMLKVKAATALQNL